MPFSNNFPYTDLHDINLNKFLKAIKNLLGGRGGEYLKKQSNIPFDYAWESMELSAPVQSVNGQTGNVVLDADDVGALPNTYTAPVQSVNGQTGTVVLDADDVGALSDTTKYAGSNTIGGSSKNTEAIPFAYVDATSTATAFTATVPGITELKTGTIVLLRNNVITSASGVTLNINDLGAKPIYSSMSNATAITTTFNINYTMMFIFDENRIPGGCWMMYYGYYTSTNSIGYQIRAASYALPTLDKFYRYRLLFTSPDGASWIPANTSTSTSATTAKTPNSRPFNPFGPIVIYYATTAINANATVSASSVWTQYAFAFGYSFNDTGSALNLIPMSPVYVVATPQSDGSAVLFGYTQNLPTSEDGKIYICIGYAYSATNVEILQDKPVYWYKNGSIRLFTNADSSGGGGAVQSVNGQTGAVVLDAPDVGALPDTYVAPVQSVNGQTGAVVLDANDVGALPDTYVAPVQSVNGQTGTVVLDAQDVGALPDTYVAPVQSVNGQTGAVTVPLPTEGSNYIQFPSGMMMCWGVTGWTAVTANSYSDVSVVFPVSFIDDPIIIAGMGSDSSAAEMGNLSVATYYRSSTGATFRIFSKASNGRSPRVFWQAVGKWK